MTTGTMGRICLAVEIDGKACFVALPPERLQMLVHLAASLSDNGKLPLAACPAGYLVCGGETMTETKHPAEVLADSFYLSTSITWRRQAAAMLRRIPVLEAELARERASRQQAQIDLERAKEDRNRAVIETRRKVAEERAPLTDEQILEAAEPFGAFEYGDAQGDARIKFARAIEKAHSIWSNK